MATLTRSCGARSSQYSTKPSVSTIFTPTHGFFSHTSFLSVAPRHVFRRVLSSNQLATALRPFYFAVHPDLFGKHPRERAVNENSLKHLNAHLEKVQLNRTVAPTNFKFYLRSHRTKTHAAVQDGSLDTLKSVDISVKNQDLRMTVHHILKCCEISTSYLESLPAPQVEVVKANAWKSYTRKKPNPWDLNVDDVETALSKKAVNTLNEWLRKNHMLARIKLESTRPIREETERLKCELCKHLGIREILWNCGWGIAHFKGCLQSLESLGQHHQEFMKNLKSRTVVFGSMTGMKLDGQIILSSGDVRNSWLELIKVINQEDIIRKRIPAVELAVSRVLRDIKVVHRKFQPAVAAKTYENHLRVLSAKLADFWVKNGYPSSWPLSLSSFQLVVECDAGPLMLSPTGQFIVPASCPAFVVAKFLTDNLDEAKHKLLLYKENKRVEEVFHNLCVHELQLTALRKDDNVTPDRMIHCMQRLIQHKETLLEYVGGTRINITHFYSVLEDGEMCFPWNCV